MSTFAWDRHHKHEQAVRTAIKEGVGGWRRPTVWAQRAARLRRSIAGVQLRRPRK